jgi:hypothetical protein
MPLYLFIVFINVAFFNLLFQVQLKNLSVDAWHTVEKDLFYKMATQHLERKYSKITIFNAEPQPTVLLYAFYNLKADFEDVDSNVLSKRAIYQVNNVAFAGGCPKDAPPDGELYIIRSVNCREYVGKLYVLSPDKSNNNYNYVTSKNSTTLL